MSKKLDEATKRKAMKKEWKKGKKKIGNVKTNHFYFLKNVQHFFCFLLALKSKRTTKQKNRLFFLVFSRFGIEY